MIELRNHHCLAPMVRYSDGFSQYESSNESQLDIIYSAIEAADHGPKVPFEFRSAHTGRDPSRKQLTDAYDKIKAYNRRTNTPLTLVLLSDWDRWFRNAMKSVEWVNKFKEIGVEINSVKRWAKFDNANDLAMFFLEQCRAQSYSDSISDNVVRNQKGHLKRGYIPYRVRGRYLGRHVDGANRWLFWKPEVENLRKAARLLLFRSTLAHAYHSTGGREVHGAIQSFTDSLKDEKMQGRYKGHKLSIDPFLPEYEWQDLQRILTSNRVVTHKDRSLIDAYVRDILSGGPCGNKATSSTPKKNGKAKAKYYICRCKQATHYRFKRENVHEDIEAMLKEIHLSANRQKGLSKKAADRSRNQLTNLKRQKAKLERKVEEGDQMRINARKLFIAGKITEADRDATNRDTRKDVAELERVNDQISRYGEILERVLESIKNIGYFLSDYDNKLQLRDFIKVLFPDGLKYDPVKRSFRTTSINAAYCVIAEESVSYSRIKFGATIDEMATPVMGRRPGLSRTPQSDLALIYSYDYKYKIA